MKKEQLLKKQEELLDEIKKHDIATSKILRDEGFVPFNMRSNKRKMMNSLIKIKEDLEKLEKRVISKKTTTKKEIKDEEINPKTNY